jgi:hypothetical protein
VVYKVYFEQVLTFGWNLRLVDAVSKETTGIVSHVKRNGKNTS